MLGVWRVQFSVPSFFWCIPEMSGMIRDRWRRSEQIFMQSKNALHFCWSILPPPFHSERFALHCTAVICVIFSLLLVDFIALSGDSFLFIAHSRTFYRNFFFKMCSSVASDFRCATALSTKLRSNQKFKWIQCARDGPFFYHEHWLK